MNERKKTRNLVQVAMVTRIRSDIGLESAAEDVRVEHGYIYFPAATTNDKWGIYVPLHGFEPGGVFYKLTEVREDTLKFACDERRRMKVAYSDTELLEAILVPKECEQTTRVAVEMMRFPDWLGSDADFFDEFTVIDG